MSIVRRRPRRDPRRDHAADHPVHRRTASSTSRRSRALVDWQLAAGSHGISVGGSTGEPVSQTRRRADRGDARRGGRDRRPRPVPAGHRQRPHGRDARADRRGAAALGASGALVVAPYYARPQQAGLVAWYSRVASEFPDLPIIVYNVPIRSAVDIAPRDRRRLRRLHENIVGIKETTRDFEHVSYVLNECGSDFIALSGIELLCYPMLALGGRGPPELRRELRPASRSPSSTTRSSPAITSARASSTTSCTRSSTPPSSRSTRFRRSGSCASSDSCRARSRASRWRRSARRPRRGSARCCRRPTQSRSASSHTDVMVAGAPTVSRWAGRFRVGPPALARANAARPPTRARPYERDRGRAASIPSSARRARPAARGSCERC